MELEINGLQDLAEAANKLITFAGEDNVIIFDGPMGAGKTTFTKEICRALGVVDVVSSPTFSIVNEYLSQANTPVYHFDFYRIKNIQEAYDIGYEEYFYSGHLCLVEWPEKIAELLPEQYIKVQITPIGEERRHLSFVRIKS